MTSASTHALIRLVDRNPTITGAEIASELVAAAAVRARVVRVVPPRPRLPVAAGRARSARRVRGRLARASAPAGSSPATASPRLELPGVYLDGGFGVGKTHLLAALWHVAPGPKYFGTFIEYTALVGALGYAQAVRAAHAARACLHRRVRARRPGRHDAHDAASSASSWRAAPASPPRRTPRRTRSARAGSPPPTSSARSTPSPRTSRRSASTALDYRRRDTEGHAEALATTRPSSTRQRRSPLAATASRSTAFDDLIAHLATVHPSKYIKLIDGLEVIALEGVHELTDQNAALRLVAFIDRVYDARGAAHRERHAARPGVRGDMMSGGYRKKYLRSISRMIALTTGELPPHD